VFLRSTRRIDALEPTEARTNPRSGYLVKPACKAGFVLFEPPARQDARQRLGLCHSRFGTPCGAAARCSALGSNAMPLDPIVSLSNSACRVREVEVIELIAAGLPTPKSPHGSPSARKLSRRTSAHAQRAPPTGTLKPHRACSALRATASSVPDRRAVCVCAGLVRGYRSVVTDQTRRDGHADVSRLTERERRARRRRDRRQPRCP
jgi:hypothetical protein